MIQGVTILFLSIAEDCQLLLPLQLTLMKVPKLWRLIQAGLNQDVAEPTLVYQISVMTCLLKRCLLHFHLEF